MRPVCLLVMIAIGCASPAFDDDVVAGVRSLRNKPLSDAIARLGPPDSEMTAAGRRFLVWEAQGSVAVPVVAQGGAWTRNTYTSGQALSWRSEETYCRLKLEVDASDTVVWSRMDGHDQACAQYTAALTPQS
jgi:hypothetical protein